MIGILFTLAAAAAIQSPPAQYDGRWIFHEAGEFVVLELRQNAETGRVAGTLSMEGSTAILEGRVRASDVVLETVGGLPISLTGVSMVARREGSNLVVVTASPGEKPITVTMTPNDAALPAALPEDFAGRWENVSDDRRRLEVLELSVAGDSISGTLTEVEREYFSNREAVKGRYIVQGSFRNGSLEVSMRDTRTPSKVAAGSMFRRSRYLVIRIGENERGYARPGHGVVESATGMVEAVALERAIAGRVYSAPLLEAGGTLSAQRARLSLCSDRRIAWDVSDLASAVASLASPDPGAGETITRRGTWSIVLLAGAPAIRAQWQGNGYSFPLTDYFMILPSTAGDSAIVDGFRLPVTGSC